MGFSCRRKRDIVICNAGKRSLYQIFTGNVLYSFSITTTTKKISWLRAA